MLRRLDVLMVFSKFGEMLTIKDVLIRIAAAVLLSSFIGIEREKRNRPAGMRTHVLVCLGAALISLVEQETIAYVAAFSSSQINVSVGRITAGVVQGVGFIGAGTIILADRKVTGLTTAATLFCTACLGIAIGAGYIYLALIGSAIMITVLKIMRKIVIVPTFKKLSMQYVNRQEINEYINGFLEKNKVKVLDVDFHTEHEGDRSVYKNVYTLIIPEKTDYVKIVEELSEAADILAVETQNV